MTGIELDTIIEETENIVKDGSLDKKEVQKLSDFLVAVKANREVLEEFVRLIDGVNGNSELDLDVENSTSESKKDYVIKNVDEKVFDKWQKLIVRANRYLAKDQVWFDKQNERIKNNQDREKQRDFDSLQKQYSELSNYVRNMQEATDESTKIELANKLFSEDASVFDAFHRYFLDDSSRFSDTSSPYFSLLYFHTKSEWNEVTM